MKAAAKRTALMMPASGPGEGASGIRKFLTKAISSVDSDRMMAALQSIACIEPFAHHGKTVYRVDKLYFTTAQVPSDDWIANQGLFNLEQVCCGVWLCVWLCMCVCICNKMTQAVVYLDREFLKGRKGTMLTDAYDNGDGSHLLGYCFVDSVDPDIVVQLDQAHTCGLKQDAPFLAAHGIKLVQWCTMPLYSNKHCKSFVQLQCQKVHKGTLGPQQLLCSLINICQRFVCSP